MTNDVEKEESVRAPPSNALCAESAVDGWPPCMFALGTGRPNRVLVTDHSVSMRAVRAPCYGSHR